MKRNIIKIGGLGLILVVLGFALTRIESQQTEDTLHRLDHGDFLIQFKSVSSTFNVGQTFNMKAIVSDTTGYVDGIVPQNRIAPETGGEWQLGWQLLGVGPVTPTSAGDGRVRDYPFGESVHAESEFTCVEEGTATILFNYSVGRCAPEGEECSQRAEFELQTFGLPEDVLPYDEETFRTPDNEIGSLRLAVECLEPEEVEFVEVNPGGITIETDGTVTIDGFGN